MLIQRNRNFVHFQNGKAIGAGFSYNWLSWGWCCTYAMRTYATLTIHIKKTKFTFLDDFNVAVKESLLILNDKDTMGNINQLRNKKEFKKNDRLD